MGTMNTLVSKDGTSIAFDKVGEGPALVLVDGAFCFRKNGPTAGLAPLLAQRFTVYSYDRRGRGESTEVLPYSLEREVEDLATVMKYTGEVPFVVGFSSGAALVLHALASGVSARKAVLFEPPYVGASGIDNAPPRNAGSVLTGLIKEGKRDEAVKYFMSTVMGIPGIFVFLFRTFGKASWRKNESVAHTLAYDVALMGDFSVPTKIASSVVIPTAVIGGEKSPAKLKSAVEAVSRSIPNSKAIFLRGQSHNVKMSVLARWCSIFLNTSPILPSNSAF